MLIKNLDFLTRRLSQI